MKGQLVGKYEIVDKIAVGGMGVVYRARHQLIGKIAAVKLLRQELSKKRNVIDRFFTEARATIAIPHPGVIEIFDFGYHTDERAYLVMEYLDGETLKSRFRRHGQLDPEYAASIVRSVASAVGAAHDQGVVHRDLKPDNIFLVPDPDMPGGERVKVLDFGLAKLLYDEDGASHHTRTGAIMGTPTYMSPEQCRGAGVVDHRSDVYALGCILFELVCGRPPFVSEGVGEVIGAHQYAPPPTLRSVRPELSEGLSAIVARALEKSPDARFQSMAELVAALDEEFPRGSGDGLEETGDYTPPPGEWERRMAQRPSRRRLPLPAEPSSPDLGETTPLPAMQTKTDVIAAPPDERSDDSHESSVEIQIGEPTTLGASAGQSIYPQYLSESDEPQSALRKSRWRGIAAVALLLCVGVAVALMIGGGGDGGEPVAVVSGNGDASDGDLAAEGPIGDEPGGDVREPDTAGDGDADDGGGGGGGDGDAVRGLDTAAGGDAVAVAAADDDANQASAGDGDGGDGDGGDSGDGDSGDGGDDGDSGDDGGSDSGDGSAKPAVADTGGKVVKPKPRRRPPPSKVRVRVRVQPSKAHSTVKVDGVARGDTLHLVRGRKYHIEVIAPGFRPWQRTLTPRSDDVLAVKLVRRAPISVDLSSP